MNLFGGTVYVRVSRNAMRVRLIDSGEEITVRPETPFSSQRLLVGEFLVAENTLKGAIHWRRDAHWEQGVNYDNNNNITTIDPAKQLSEETTSFAVENTFHATRYLDVDPELSA